MPDVTAGVGYPGGLQSAAAPNPLDMIGKVLQIQQAQTGLQMQQQELKFRQAIGPILQQSIDPQTGELDTSKVLIHGSANPDTAWGMPNLVHQMLENGQIKADTALKDMAVAKQQWEMTTGIAQGLVTKAQEAAAKRGKIDPTSGKWIPATPILSHLDVANGLSDLVAAGGMDAKDAAAFLTRNASSSPEQNFQMIDRIQKSGQNIDQGIARLTPILHDYSMGGKNYQRTFTPGTGQLEDAGQLTQQPTVEQLNAPQQGVNAKQQPTVRSAAEVRPFYDASGNVVTTPHGPAANVTGLSPMEQKLAEERAKTANDYESGLNDANTTGQENLRVLREMQDAMKEFKTGGGMEVRQRLAQLAQGVGMPQKLVDDLAGGNRGAIAEFQKLAVRYATQEMKTNMGQAQKFTNLDFSTFLKNNPTIDTDPRGLEKMFGFLEKGVWRMQQQQEYYNRWKQGERPKDFANAGMDAFPAFWTRVLSKATPPATPATAGAP
jgi:hypothetical protein